MGMIIFDLHGGQTPYSNRTLWYYNSMFGSSHSASTAYQKKQKVSKCSPINKYDQF